MATNGEGEFSSEDLRGLSETDAWNRVHEVARKEAATPFCLQQQVTYRVAILFIGPASTVVILSLHHVTADAWSMTTLCREWSILYDSCVNANQLPLIQQKPDMLPPVTHQCSDGALVQRRWIASDCAREQEAWWGSQARLAVSDSSPLRWDFPRLPVPYLRTSRQVLEIPRIVGDGIKALQQECGVSAFEIVASAFSVVLANWLRQDSVIFGSLVANRRLPGTQRCLGAFYNTVPYIFRFSRDSNVWELIDEWRTKVAGVDEHQELPFPLIAKTFSDVQSMLAPRLCQIMLYVDRYPAEQLRFNGDSGIGIHYDPRSSFSRSINTCGHQSINEYLRSPSREVLWFRTASNADLSFFMRQGGKTKTLSVFYKTDLIKDSTVIWLIDSFIAVLLQMAENGDQSVGDLVLSEY